MKELSIEEKAKAYDGNYKVYTELINRLEDVKDAIKKQNYGIAMDILCKPYPEFQITTSTELKESEDEKIRKELIFYLRHQHSISENFEDIGKWIAWLEKQGEQKEINLVEILKHYPKETELYSPLYGKLWFAEVDEENEIITCYKYPLNKGCTRAILEQEDTVSFYSDGTIGLPDFSVSKDCMLFLYDIEKRGEQKPATIDIDKMVDDYANNKERGNKEFGKPVNCMIRAYRQGLIDAIGKVVLKPAWSEEDDYNLQCMIAKVTSDIQKGNVGRNQELIDWLKSLRPQSKQVLRDTFGYEDGRQFGKNEVLGSPKKYGLQRFAEWSKSDKEIVKEIDTIIHGTNSISDEVRKKLQDWLKSLKDRVQPKQRWSEEDEKRLQSCLNVLQARGIMEDTETVNTKWLKSLKGRVQLQQEWSEEDEKKRRLLISILEVNHPNGCFKVNPANTLNMEAMHTEELVSWLKSLRPQNTWKPTTEQLTELRCVISGCSFETSILVELEEDLKKLL